MGQAVLWSGKPTFGKTGKVQNWYVQDGDSLSLANGHRLARTSKRRPEQAYAQHGKHQLKQKLQQQTAIYLQLLPETKDHYGHWLVKLYDGAGSPVEAFMVAQGLAYVIGMNGQGAEDCLWQQEEVARICRPILLFKTLFNNNFSVLL
jgi:endonuclease YncB( thermonuclease family)